MMPAPQQPDAGERADLNATLRHRVAFSPAEIRECEAWIAEATRHEIRRHAARVAAMRRLRCVTGLVQDRLEKMLSARCRALGVTLEDMP